MFAKELNSCHISIPFPTECCSDFNCLLSDVKKIDSRLELTTHPPHLTLLHIKSDLSLDTDLLLEATKPVFPVIREKTINVGGYGDFNGSLVYLKVLSPKKELKNCRSRIASAIGAYDYSNFYFHVTVCRLPKYDLNEKTKKNLFSCLNDFKLSFEAKNIVIKKKGPQLDTFTPEDFAFAE